jgi:hypothetical protein
MRSVQVRFRTLDKIRRMCDGREIIVFSPWSIYTGDLLGDGSVLAESEKCPGKIINIGKKEVEILETLSKW